jgi:molybdate transport system substrate-binding protein
MAQLSVLSAGAVKRGVAQVCEQYGIERGTPVDVVFATAPEVRRRVLGGEAPDVVVAPPAVLDDLVQAKRIAADTRRFVGRSRMGIVVHASRGRASAPADVAAFKSLLLGAGAVVRNSASSGIYAAKLLDQLELTGLLGARLIVVDSGAAVMQHVAAHPDAIGLAQIPEIRVQIDKGLSIALLGPLPDAIQNATSYEAAATSGGERHEAAAALAARLASPAANAVFAANGIEPL